jgi:hypothetical protein
VIADLLGVPEEDHKQFRTKLGADRPGARVGSLEGEVVDENPLQFLDGQFHRPIWRIAGPTRARTS